MTAPCPCKSGLSFEDCCGPALSGLTPAKTALALMRSRFTAYKTGNHAYLRQTAKRDPLAVLDPGYQGAASKPDVEWVDLEIVETVAGGGTDETGIVSFTAHYRQNGQVFALRERSNFERRNGAWIYTDGVIDPNTKPGWVRPIGRNDPCPCTSGRKFKKCCGAR